jgi:protein ImuA
MQGLSLIAPTKKTDILSELQMDILRLQGFNSVHNTSLDIGLGPLKDSFPNASFPLGAVHEFLSSRTEDVAATSGFISGILTSLMGSAGTTIWISSSRTLFPPALKSFGIEPDRFIFIDLQKDKDVLWAMNEALKCGALSAVVGEIREIDFTASRRLQLSVEQSKVTGFVLHKHYRKLHTTACVSRWKITPLPSVSIAPNLYSDSESSDSYRNYDYRNEDGAIDDLPGISFPKWRVELLRMRNGKSGVWDIQWINGKFAPVYKSPFILHHQQKKAG